MALSPPANTDMATMQALERTEERLDAKIDAVAARLDAKIDQLGAKIDHVAELLETKMVARIRSSEPSTRLWTFLMIASAQVASIAYLRNVLG